MKKPNDKVKSVIVLTVICLIVTALLAVTNSFTSPVIEKTRAAKIEASLKAVFPDMISVRNAELPEGCPSTVKSIYYIRDQKYDVECCAIVLGTMSAYSSGEMGITVGISSEGEIVGIKLTSYFESKDFGKDTYPLNYLGRTGEDYSEVDTYAGVTYSSNALKKAIGDAFTAISLLEGGVAQ